MTKQAALSCLLCHLSAAQSLKDDHPEQVSRHCIALTGIGPQVSARAVELKFSMVRTRFCFQSTEDQYFSITAMPDCYKSF